jgi:hypothetical protein
MPFKGVPLALIEVAHESVQASFGRTTVAQLLDGWAGSLRRIHSSLTTPADPWPTFRWGAFDYVRALRHRTDLHAALAPLLRDPRQGFDVLDALDGWFRSFTMDDVDHVLGLVEEDAPTDLWWWSRVPVSGAILNDLLRYQADPTQVRADREVHTNRVHPGRLETVDGQASLPFSRELIVATFADGLWYALNEKHGLLIDEYEQEEIPVTLLDAVAADIRKFGDSDPSGRLREEINAVANFLDHALSLGTAVWLIL